MLSWINIDEISCSKERKCQAIHYYWTKKNEQYYARSDDVPETDSQDEKDHQCWPTDPAAATMQSPPERY